jgi:serine protease inhibitor
MFYFSFQFLYSENSTTAAPTLIWSPQSVYTALSALLDGAGGDTEVELRDLLQQQSFPLETNKNNNKTDVSSTPFRTSSEEQSKSGLNVTTGIFISNEYKLSKGFSEKLLSRQSQKNDRSSNKFGKLDTLPLDFSQAEESAQIVNSWVNQSTGGLIQQIVQPHQFNSNAKLVLANAVQFKVMI